MDKEILDKCKEISKWVRDTQNPHTAVIINDNQVKVVQAKMGILTKNDKQ